MKHLLSSANIFAGIKRENTLLQERERKLREREKALRDADKLGETTSIVIDRLVDEEVERRTQEVAEVTVYGFLLSVWLSLWPTSLGSFVSPEASPEI